MKRIGSLTLAALLGIATWYAGPGWRAQQQAFAQVPISGVGNDDPGFYLLSHFDVSTSFDASAAGYGGPGHSGGAGDALLRLVDVGNFETGATTGDVCANIYVWNDLQELQECCSCPLSGNVLATSSVINNLTSNPNNSAESLEAGVIKIIGSSGACSNDIATEVVTAASLVPADVAEGIHAWLNHTESMASNNPGFKPPFGFITSTSVAAFDTSPLDAAELSRNTTKCASIVADDSTSSKTTGICSCVTETPPPPPPPPPPVPIAPVTSSSNDNTTAGADTLTIDIPPKSVVGDFLFATVVLQTGGSGVGNHAADLTVSPPPGWTLVLHTAMAGTDIQLNTYWEVNAAPGALETWGFSGGTTDSIALAAGGISDYSGVDTASPIENASGEPNASSTSIVAPSVTTTVANSLIIGAFGINGVNGITAPSDMSDVYSHNSTDGPSVENAHKIQAAIGASGPDTATAVNADINIGQQIAVAPAP